VKVKIAELLKTRKIEGEMDKKVKELCLYDFILKYNSKGFYVLNKEFLPINKGCGT